MIPHIYIYIHMQWYLQQLVCQMWLCRLINASFGADTLHSLIAPYSAWIWMIASRGHTKTIRVYVYIYMYMYPVFVNLYFLFRPPSSNPNSCLFIFALSLSSFSKKFRAHDSEIKMQLWFWKMGCAHSLKF